MSCEKCIFRSRFDRNPKSLLGRFWRWHIRFCPGWKRYYREQPEEKKLELTELYELKSK